MNLDLSGTFDSTNSLSSMYLWVIFGYLASLINCDLQRFVHKHPMVLHIIGLTAFFFLFTLLDSKNDVGLGWIWLKTLFIYILFIMMTKSKYYFIIPVMILLLADQSLKKHLAYKTKDTKDPVLEKRIKLASSIMNIVIISLITIGCFHYMYLQKREYKKEFSLIKFFIGTTKCKKQMPRYSRM